MASTRVPAEFGERIAEDGPVAHHRLLRDRAQSRVACADGPVAS